MGLDVADNHITAGFPLALGGFEHRERFANPWAHPKKDLEPPALSGGLLLLDGSQKLVWIGLGIVDHLVSGRCGIIDWRGFDRKGGGGATSNHLHRQQDGIAVNRLLLLT